MTGPDDLDVLLADQMTDPAFAAAYRDAQHRSDLLDRRITARKDAGLTVAQVAERMQQPRRRVVDFENGATDPYFSFLQSYARAVGRHLRTEI